MASPEESWLQLVDEPIGRLVLQFEQGEPELTELMRSPRRLLAFRTFASIRVGLVCGQLLVDNDLEADGGETWLDRLLRDPEHRARVERELRRVADEIARDARYADDEDDGEPAAARERFRSFARARLGSAL